MAKRDSKGKDAKKPENDNFVRLCALLIDEGRKILKDIFDRLHPADNLQQLLGVPVIHAALKEFYPDMSTNGLRFNKNSSEFDDIALLWLLVYIAKTLPDRSLPLKFETELALTRINVHRLDLCVRNEKSKTNISDDEFKRLWNGIEGMLSGFGPIMGREAEISKMKDAPINSEMKKHYTKLLEKWSQCEDYRKKHQAAQKQVDGTNETEAKGHDDGKQGPSSTTKNVETQLQTEIERIAQVIEDIQPQFEASRLADGEKVREIRQRRTACINIDRNVKILQAKLEALRISTDDEMFNVVEGKVKDLSHMNEKLTVEFLKNITESLETKSKLEELTTEHEVLKEKSEKTEDKLSLLTKDMEEMKAFKKELEIEREILNFAQFCWDIEGLMYKYVFPSKYKGKKKYRLQDIEDEIAELEKTSQKDSKKATKKFEELKEKLNWVSPDYEDSMDDARSDRNYLAHPRMSLPKVEQCIKFLHENEKLQDWMTPERAGKLKDIWEELWKGKIYG